MNKKTKTITLAGIFSSLVFLLAMTPVGLIPLGFINLTIVHIPVIIGTIVLGKRMGVILGAAFGLASTLAAFGMSLALQSGLAAALLSYSALAVIIMSIVPRMLIPIVTNAVHTVLMKRNQHASRKKHLTNNTIVAISSVAGSLTNTIGYLGLMGLFFAMYGNWARFAGIFTVTLFIGAICESAVAALIAIPVVNAIGAIKESEEIKKVTRSITEEDAEPLPLSEVDEGVEQTNVAVLPHTEVLIPQLNETQVLMNKKALAYLESGANTLAQKMFERFVQSFETDKYTDVRVYVAMRYTEAGQYATAANILHDVFGSSSDTHLGATAKTMALGMLNIIHTANMNNSQIADNVQLQSERVFAKMIKYIEADSYVLAAHMLDMYIVKSALA